MWTKKIFSFFVHNNWKVTNRFTSFPHCFIVLSLSAPSHLFLLLCVPPPCCTHSQSSLPVLIFIPFHLTVLFSVSWLLSQWWWKATTNDALGVKLRMKDKQQVSWQNKQITVNKHHSCQTASGNELQGWAAPIRMLCFSHVTALSLCLALFMTGRVRKKKKEREKRKSEWHWDGVIDKRG